ncbi:MAG: response regulator transcription factor [Candidatus Helarchaeota archaeon]
MMEVTELKSLILVVEDNPGIIYNLKMTLEFNNYDVISAKNGREAIDLLSDSKRLPDLIISDIMMPEMDGYEFFKTLSNNPNWNQIPFLFLTAKSSSEDVRLGKTLGVDDYITKPFNEADLLASISGKLKRKRNSNSITQRINNLLQELDIDLSPSISEKEKDKVSLSYFLWDEKVGPELKKFFPIDSDLKMTMQSIGPQLFIATASIYGQKNLNQAQGLLLNVENINSYSYIYFDSIPDENVRGGQRRFMLAAVAPKISYFESLKIKKVFEKISNLIKNNEDWDEKKSWKEISDILSTPALK